MAGLTLLKSKADWANHQFHWAGENQVPLGNIDWGRGPDKYPCLVATVAVQVGKCVTAPTCTKKCQGKACGDDGCGGDCGKCAAAQICESFQCVDAHPCVPLCVGKACGSDGCGGACGACMPPERCSDNGRCYDPSGCVPACNGRECAGDDGCGGTCGTCRSGQTCSDTGKCLGDPSTATDVIDNTRDFGQGDASGCPVGTVMSYGSCVAVVVGKANSGGGCLAGPVGPMSGHAMAALLALAAMAARRRRRS